MRRASAMASAFLAASAAFGGSDTLYVENDVTSSRDYEYTHGTKLSHELGPTLDVYAWQGIYTPRDKESESVQPGDRPYAGWLAVGCGKRFEWLGMRHLSEASVGVVGPSSLAEQTQTSIHEALGNGVPKGWDDQLDDEPALMARHESSKAFWAFRSGWASLAVVPKAEAVVGTVMDYVGAGGDVVFGFNPDPYFDRQISVRNPSGKWRLYGIAGASGRAVAWNMLLDGNMWHDSPSVDKEPLVCDLEYGACLATPWFSVSFTQVERSREFETQDGPERFGSVTISVTY